MVRMLLAWEGERLVVRLVREEVVLVERRGVGRALASNLVVGSLVM